MSNNSFLNQLNILYVEEDTQLREVVSSAMKSYINDVYIASDGIEALEIYTQLKNAQIELDAIVSDIAVLDIQGLNLLSKIREDNFDVSFVCTTAFSNIDSLNLDVNEYVSKPINFPNLIEKISRACNKKNNLSLLKKQNKELETYLSAINKVAIISKTDTKGIITYVNDNFCNITQYQDNELIGSSYRILRHPTVPPCLYKSIWTTIKAGKTWQGKVKNVAKDGSTYYVNETIIPIYDNFNQCINEFIGIRFLVTNEELEKREFKKRVLLNIQDYKKKQYLNITEIKTLQKKIKNSNVELLEDALNAERKRVHHNKEQITYYEHKINSLLNKCKILVKNSNDKNGQAEKTLLKEKNMNTLLKRQSVQLKNVLAKKEDILRKMLLKIEEQEEEIEIQSKSIIELKEVIQHQDEKLGIL